MQLLWVRQGLVKASRPREPWTTVLVPLELLRPDCTPRPTRTLLRHRVIHDIWIALPVVREACVTRTPDPSLIVAPHDRPVVNRPPVLLLERVLAAVDTHERERVVIAPATSRTVHDEPAVAVLQDLRTLVDALALRLLPVGVRGVDENAVGADLGG